MAHPTSKCPKEYCATVCVTDNTTGDMLLANAVFERGDPDRLVALYDVNNPAIEFQDHTIVDPFKSVLQDVEYREPGLLINPLSNFSGNFGQFEVTGFGTTSYKVLFQAPSTAVRDGIMDLLNDPTNPLVRLRAHDAAGSGNYQAIAYIDSGFLRPDIDAYTIEATLVDFGRLEALNITDATGDGDVSGNSGFRYDTVDCYPVEIVKGVPVRFEQDKPLSVKTTTPEPVAFARMNDTMIIGPSDAAQSLAALPEGKLYNLTISAHNGVVQVNNVFLDEAGTQGPRTRSLGDYWTTRDAVSINVIAGATAFVSWNEDV